MLNSLWRLLFLPIVLLAFFLVGTPEFPALERAIQKAFDATAESVGRLPAAHARDDVTGDGLSASHQKTVERRSPGADSQPVHKPAQNRGILVPLYVSFAALQALDAHSTMRALHAGAAEANPLMGSLAGRPAAFVAVKAGLAASTIYFVEKLRLKSRGAAVALMAALNSAYAAIVAHNYRVPR